MVTSTSIYSNKNLNDIVKNLEHDAPGSFLLFDLLTFQFLFSFLVIVAFPERS